MDVNNKNKIDTQINIENYVPSPLPLWKISVVVCGAAIFALTLLLIEQGSEQTCTGNDCTQIGEINNYGITPEDHQKALEQREQEVIERLSKTDPSDRLIREVLEKEYNTVQENLANLEQSYQAEIKVREETARSLKELKASLPEAQVTAAIKQLNKGDKLAAKALFDKTIEQAEKGNELAGKAAYENGKLAESEIRFLEAKSYYLKAVNFQPGNSLYNNKMGSILHDLGQYEEAIEYYQQALAAFEISLGKQHPYTQSVVDNLRAAKEAIALAASE